MRLLSRLGLAVVLLIAAGCGGAPAASTAAPTAVPSAPPPASVAPSVAAAVTPAPAPTFTTDDDKIASIIKDGTAETLDQLGKIGDASTTAEFRDVFKGIRDFADSEQTRVAIYTASACTKPAADLYLDGMSQLSKVAVDFLDWLAGGAVGDAPDTETATKAGQTIAAANTALQGSVC